MRHNTLFILLFGALAVACSAENTQRRSTAPVKGFLGGGVLGAAIGGAAKGAKGAGYGALVGAGVGLIGGLIAKNRKENQRYD